MRNRKRDRHGDIVDASIEALNECPVPEQIDELDWPALSHTLSENTPRKEQGMFHWKSIIPRTKLGRALAAAAAVVLAVAVVWGAERVIRSFTFKEEGVSKDVTTSDGKTMRYGSGSVWVVKSDDPDFTEEQARKRYEQIRQAIREGKVKLLRTEQDDNGVTTYVYECALPNGETELVATGRPLHDAEKLKQLDEEMAKAVAAGRGELIATRKLASGLTIYTYKVILSDGSARTYGSNRSPKAQQD